MELINILLSLNIYLFNPSFLGFSYGNIIVFISFLFDVYPNISDHLYTFLLMCIIFTAWSFIRTFRNS
ncbi:conserved hypothetical protein [Oenococcus oeni]|nr:conserved hypothetical protein [Oenococcus oeni]